VFGIGLVQFEKIGRVLCDKRQLMSDGEGKMNLVIRSRQTLIGVVSANHAMSGAAKEIGQKI